MLDAHFPIVPVASYFNFDIDPKTPDDPCQRLQNGNEEKLFNETSER